MSVKVKGVLIAACILFGSLCLLGAGPQAPAPTESSAEPAAVEGPAVLVEAFVVEVNLPALARQGVSPIGRQPHAVAVADILKCLDDGQARVIGGSKIAARARDRINVDAKKTIYVRRVAPQVSYSPYTSGGKLGVGIGSGADGLVTAEFSFTGARLAEKPSDMDAPPAAENWEWSGTVALRLGEPQIAGAVQDGQTAVFLLLVANGQSE